MATRVETMEDEYRNDWSGTLMRIGAFLLRYGLAIVLLWVGSLKFTAYETEGVLGLIANSPLLSWMLSVTSPSGATAVIGVIEIALGIMIVTRPFAPLISAIGSIGAIVMFLITLSFILTTPGVWQPGYGFPFFSMTGTFLAKDTLLLGAAIWSAGEALLAAARGSR